MAKNPLIRSYPKRVSKPLPNKSAGILDDYAVRKVVATKEGSITRTPTEDIDIVNKKYVDTLTTNHPHQDVTTTATPKFGFTTIEDSSTTSLSLKNTNNIGWSGMWFLNKDGVIDGHIGYGNAGASKFADKIFFGSTTSIPVEFTINNTTVMTLETNGDLTINSGGNITTTGDIICEDIIINNDILIQNNVITQSPIANTLVIQNENPSTSHSRLAIMSESTKLASFDLYQGISDTQTETSNFNRFRLGNTSTNVFLTYNHAGTDTTLKPMELGVEGASGFNSNQLILETDGDVSINAGDLILENDIYIGGDILFTPNSGNGLTYGSMYNHDNVTTVTISAINTAVRIPSGFSAGSNNNSTFQNSREIAISEGGVWKIDWSISFTTASANQEIEGFPMINNVMNTQASAHRRISTATDTGAMSGTCIIELNDNDVISLGVLNETSTANVIIQHSNMTIMKVGADT